MTVRKMKWLQSGVVIPELASLREATPSTPRPCMLRVGTGALEIISVRSARTSGRLSSTILRALLPPPITTTLNSTSRRRPSATRSNAVSLRPQVAPNTSCCPVRQTHMLPQLVWYPFWKKRNQVITSRGLLERSSIQRSHITRIVVTALFRFVLGDAGPVHMSTTSVRQVPLWNRVGDISAAQGSGSAGQNLLMLHLTQCRDATRRIVDDLLERLEHPYLITSVGKRTSYT